MFVAGKDSESDVGYGIQHKSEYDLSETKEVKNQGSSADKLSRAAQAPGGESGASRSAYGVTSNLEAEVKPTPQSNGNEIDSWHPSDLTERRITDWQECT